MNSSLPRFFCRLWLPTLFVLTASPSPSPAQTPASTSETTIPELEALRAPYQKNIATIRAAAEARVQPITHTYIAALERLEKETAARGDTVTAEAIKAEKERMTSKVNPTPSERQRMPAVLVALRDRYDKDVERTIAPFQQQEQQQTRQYISALDTEQRRLVSQNQIQKAAVVTAERTAVAGAPAGKGADRNEKIPAESTVRANGKLDPALADKIAGIVNSRSFTKTDSSSGGQEGGVDVPAEGALLVGFEFMEVKSPKGAWVRSLRPYFMNRENIVPGKDRGKVLNVTDKVLARPGYAVAGLLASDGKTGLQVIFMKIDPATGRFDTNPSNAYKSKWFGTKGRDKPMQIGGDGRLVIGVFGKSGADCDTIGLIQMP